MRVTSCISLVISLVGFPGNSRYTSGSRTCPRPVSTYLSRSSITTREPLSAFLMTRPPLCASRHSAWVSVLLRLVCTLLGVRVCCRDSLVFEMKVSKALFFVGGGCQLDFTLKGCTSASPFCCCSCCRGSCVGSRWRVSFWVFRPLMWTLMRSL